MSVFIVSMDLVLCIHIRTIVLNPVFWDSVCVLVDKLFSPCSFR